MAAGLGIVALVIMVLLTISALFSAAETALTSVSRGRMHQLERDGDKAARRVNQLTDDQETMIGAVLLGNNLINILSAALLTEVCNKIFPGGVGVAIATVITTTLVLVYAEVLPKTLAIGRPDETARLLSAPILLVVRLFGPMIGAIQWVIRTGLSLVGFDISPPADASDAQDEIRGAVEYHHAEGLVKARDRRMLGGVLDLAEMDVSDVMVHRRAISMLDIDLSPREFVDQALQSPYTRLPIYRDEPENIIGVMHARDLARAVSAVRGDVDSLDLVSIAREPWFIPETTNLNDQLQAFLRRKSHFALIVDEYGALMGLVTLEDILEEIVGEIDDEHDSRMEGMRRQPDGSVNVDGGVAIRDLNRAMDWMLPDEDATTVAGLVIHEAQTIPEPGQTFIFHHHRFQVLRRQRNQITALRVSPPLQGPQDR
jgi:Mg2+/Co2+ transporter CorB